MSDHDSEDHDTPSNTAAVKGELETKLIELRLSRQRTRNVIEGGIESRIVRHRETLYKLTVVATEAKQIEERKRITTGGDLDEVANWPLEKEEGIAEVDKDINDLVTDDTEQQKVARNKKELLEQKLQYNYKELQFLQFQINKLKVHKETLPNYLSLLSRN